MGFEGANVIFDTWVHPLVMGLEEHLLTMFREDFEFHDAAGPSHHGAKASARAEAPLAAVEASGGDIFAERMSGEAGDGSAAGEVIWLADAERELRKIPFFVRGKAKRNTEKFAAERGVAAISIDTLYEAKAHYAR
jgi:light-independent protochlorophyllide reductase subunit B